MMKFQDRDPEEQEAGLVLIGRIYQRVDCASAAVIVILGDAAYQFADPKVLTHLVLRHCSERIKAKSIREPKK